MKLRQTIILNVSLLLIAVIIIPLLFFALRAKDPVIGGIFLSATRVKGALFNCLVCLCILFVCLVWGRIIWQVLKLPSAINDLPLIFAFGLGIIFFCVVLFFTAAIGIYRSLILSIWGGVTLVLAIGAIIKMPQQFSTLSFPDRRESTFRGVISTFFFTALGIALFPVFISALAPPNNWDELVYHLTNPKKYLSAGGFVYMPFLLYENMPHYLNLLYGWLMSYGTESAPRLFHFSLGIATAIVIWQICIRYFDKLTAGLSVAIFLTTPLITAEMSVAMVDVGLAFFFLLGLMALFFWDDSTGREQKWLWVAGIFAGIQAGCKYQGVYGLIALLGCLIFIQLKRFSLGATIKAILYFLTPAFLLLLPWLIKNVIMVRNPVYPNLYSIFGGRDWTAEHTQQMRIWLGSMGMGKSVLDFFLLFWRLPIKGWYYYSRFAGIITPFYFLPLPLLLIFRCGVKHRDWQSESEKSFSQNKLTYLMITALIYLIVWFTGSQQLRFLIPSLALFAILSGVALGILLQRIATAMPRISNILNALCLGCIVATGILAEPIDFLLLGQHLNVTLGRCDRDTFLAGSISDYKMVKYINQHLPPKARVLMLFDNRGYYLQREYIAEGTFEVSRIAAVIGKASSPEDILKFCQKFGITHILLHQVFWQGYSGDFIRRFYPDFEKNFNLFSSKYLRLITQIDKVDLYQLTVQEN
ncbi:MAG: glycosyltransferase family 39 protein [Candidatus Sumerlaeia bacterium]|nr:glycosyltransferase family 39 protein [Candidatus Sumerlaeia bacterium]